MLSGAREVEHIEVRFFRFSLFVLCATVSPVLDAEPQRGPAARPTIGVALEGGGALGLAHIGVLQWLESHRIPIDYIAGTSMGGLIGGIYATGMSADELRQLVANIDWGKTLDPRIPYQAMTFRRKEDKRAFQNDLEFGLRMGFSLPGGLTSGQEISFLLDRMAVPYANVKSFDELPIPFRCIAADLTSGKEHVFESGPLGEALRATMSLPGVFTPVVQGESILADGGLLNNLPVDVVKRMGADIVIAVHLKGLPFGSGNPQSMLSIMNRSVSVMIEANEIHSLETADLVIPIEPAGYTSTDYEAASQIIVQGLQGAETKAQALTRLSLSEAEWQQHLAARESRRKRSAPNLEFIKVTGSTRSVSEAIEKELQHNAGKPLETERLEDDLAIISGSGRFTRLSYRVTETAGRSGLEVSAQEKDYAPPLLNLGFLIDGSEISAVRWTANARITALDVGGFRTEWRNDFSAGSTWGFASEYYHPWSQTAKWFMAPRILASSTPLDLYDRSIQLAEYRIRRYGGGLDVGYAINRFSELRIGYETGYLDSALQIGAPLLPAPHGRTGSATVRYVLDNLDSPLVPRSGEMVSFSAGWNDAAPGASRGFPRSEVSAGIVRRVSKPASAYLQALAGTTLGYKDTGIPQFFLGGPNRLSAYGKNELRTNDYWLVRIGYIHELFSLPPILGKKTYFTSAYEVARVYRAPGASRLPTDGSAGVVAETIIGPLFLGGSIGDSGHRRVYFSLGRFF